MSLSCVILPQSFDTIQSIHLDFRFSLSFYFAETTPCNDWPRWERTWRILASMRDLKTVWLRISWPRERSAPDERTLLESLCMLTHLDTFEVSLPALDGEEVQ
jgi:hypothetical protein